MIIENGLEEDAIYIILSYIDIISLMERDSVL